MKIQLLAVIAAASLISAAPVFAQEANADAGRTLPEVCTSSATMSHDMGAMSTGGGDMSSMTADEAHKDLMTGMDQMHANMMQGMMAEDVDVAFLCGMIPHHQGAIDMAKAELKHGDDPWAKEMAQKVIDAQEKEIAEMTAHLEQLKK